MELRVLIVVGIAVLFVAVLVAARQWVENRRLATINSDAPEFATPGHATVLYFYTTSCDPCERIQKPELNRLATNTAHVVVRAIDAVADQPIAKRFRIMTVPSTVVLNPDGRVLGVNYGVALQATLLKQIFADGDALNSR